MKISFFLGAGYRSSWPLSAFTHHVLWWCAEQVYPGRLFTGYALLGDDILITDKKAEYAQEDEAEAEGSKPRKAPVIHSIQWQPPPPGWMKVNTDGCSRGQPGPSSCGGIFRNCRGFVHGCFALSLGSGFAYQAEWVGVMTAIAIAHSKGWKYLWIESDSTYVVF
ncbi:UNVERIFIED_CONTAM: putative ribonuclease H protein [Sesamum angustifolium]|uniref:Ribonuclease H protein n=1 Tax=Sesamum angustifolium TaxID=2727405 RepID=A0AAW2JWJ8_9LAMI